MKFFGTLFFLSFFALAYSAALSKPDIEYEVAKREIEASNAKFVPGQLPDGKNSVAVYEGDVFEGTISEGENGDVIVKDAYGNIVNVDDDDEEGDLEKRIIGAVIRVFAVFIRRYGARAWVSDSSNMRRGRCQNEPGTDNITRPSSDASALSLPSTSVRTR